MVNVSQLSWSLPFVDDSVLAQEPWLAGVRDKYGRQISHLPGIKQGQVLSSGPVVNPIQDIAAVFLISRLTADGSG